MPETSAGPTCPKCEKQLIDQRANREPGSKRPLWKCPDRQCDGKPIWSPFPDYAGAVCPTCSGSMWQKRPNAKGPEWSCRARPKWNSELKATVGGGCPGLLWNAPDAPAPAPKAVAAIYGPSGIVKKMMDAYLDGVPGPLGRPPADLDF